VKSYLIFFFLVLGLLPVQAQDKPQEPSARKPQSEAASPSAAPAKIDPAKEADIRRLLKVMGTEALVQQTISSMEAELQENGKKWGGELGEQSMHEVLAEHPELAEALEKATKGDHP